MILFRYLLFVLTNYQTIADIGFSEVLHSWCTEDLCTLNGMHEEQEDRLLQQQGKTRKSYRSKENFYISFDARSMYESSFMSLFYGEPQNILNSKMIVVSTSYGNPPRNSLEWINRQPWPVFVSSKESNFGIASEPWGNIGLEVASYVRFILLFWDYLPEHIAFVHGHEKAWHQEGYHTSYMLRNLCVDEYEYISLSAYEGGPIRKGSNLNYYKILKRFWYLVEPYLGKFPKSGFNEKCCAQFMVSRERIKRRPREMYELILKEMTDTKKKYGRARDGKHVGWDLAHFWEGIWHYIMGERAYVNTKKKYGHGIDVHLETGSRLSKRADRTLKNVISCPQEVDKRNTY